MRCPKCGHDNPENTCFCEECDWRLDQKYRKKVAIPPLYLLIASIALGALAILFYFLTIKYVPIVLGGVGMVIGGYGMNVSRILHGNNSRTMILSLLAIGLSVIGFMFGIMMFISS